MKYLLTILLALASLEISAQSNFRINFLPVIASEQLAQGSSFFTARGDSLRIDVLRFYISGIEVNAGPVRITDSLPAHLIDLDDSSTWSIVLPLIPSAPSYTVKLSIGIDSLTNSTGAHGGALDPALGMYWTWQSGYINFKMEGMYKGWEFQFHIGGYQHPFNSLRTVELQTTSTSPVITMDPENLFSNININTTHHIMSPGVAALEFADRIAASFRIQP